MCKKKDDFGEDHFYILPKGNKKRLYNMGMYSQEVGYREKIIDQTRILKDK